MMSSHVSAEVVARFLVALSLGFFASSAQAVLINPGDAVLIGFSSAGDDGDILDFNVIFGESFYGAIDATLSDDGLIRGQITHAVVTNPLTDKGMQISFVKPGVNYAFENVGLADISSIQDGTTTGQIRLDFVGLVGPVDLAYPIAAFRSGVVLCPDVPACSAALYDGGAPVVTSVTVVPAAATAVVPVPAAMWLFGSALGLMGAMRQKASA